MKFIVTDDHGIFRSGLKLIIENLYADAEVQEAATGQELLQLLEDASAPDLVLLDLNLPDSDGLEWLSRLRSGFPTVPIVVISASEERHLIQEAIQLGAAGYIPKSSPNAVIASAIQLVLSGGIYVPHELMRMKDTSIPPIASVNLTPRQFEVLKLLAEGMSNKQIGTELDIAPGTIKAHIAAIFRELNAANRTQAVHRARELKLL